MVEPISDGFEAAFTALLAGDESALGGWLGADAGDQARLDVYRNTVAKARVDALAGLYPTIERLVGPDWFRQAGLIFAGDAPPSSPVLDLFGAEFPAWLETFPPALDLPYLAAVARLDQAWNQAHRAPDAPVLSGRVATETPPARLFASRAGLHPSARLFWFDWTVPSIWIANRAQAVDAAGVAWEAQPEGLLIVRHAQVVTWRRLSRAEWSFLRACQRGRTLGEAAQAAFAIDPQLNLAAMFAGLLEAGALSTLQSET
ncbi:MAG: DNA-binding domain-containing protein [Brevundimonas sp.]|uniref:HvfC/BufC N-terminal domain-containing protein n=1 Tax=Brevundimonas sp. TaxID=1871086 RepID=UPI002615D6FB|nr:DNA-binding domain-containing protein [Brevundimonas sp.]MDI6623210.1 DNA-binding domain-containing protein [Brevundimonas sp.]MDQ7811386.1 DNA-binding domain-containing protein [Brevundimonas sp.]